MSQNGLPRVSDILKACGLAPDYSFLSPAKLAEVQNRGKALHLAIELDAQGVLDEDSLHPVIRPLFSAYRRFVDDTGYQAEASELELTHPWGFMGHLDSAGVVDGRVVIIDWKSGNDPDVASGKLQLAAYRLLWDSVPKRGGKAEACYLVNLRTDGTYKVIDVTDDHSCQVFAAALLVYRHKQEMGR